MKIKLEQLVKIIEDHPNCTIDIDNDYWEIMSGETGDYDKDLIASSDNFNFDTRWYGHSNNYGFGIAEALKIILNKKGFNLKIQAV